MNQHPPPGRVHTPLVSPHNEVPSPAEIQRLLAHMHGVTGLLTHLLYGSGLRLLEALRLRVQDVDLQQRRLTVREGRGGRERLAVLPMALERPLRLQLESARRAWESDRQRGPSGASGAGAAEGVALVQGAPSQPDLAPLAAAEPSYPLPAQDAQGQAAWENFWVFPSPTLWVEAPPRSSADHDGTSTRAVHTGLRRPHLHEKRVQRDLKTAVAAAGLTQHITIHTLRHAFATHLLQAGADIRTVQALMGHSDIGSTMAYANTVPRGPRVDAFSPLDALMPADGQVVPDASLATPPVDSAALHPSDSQDLAESSLVRESLPCYLPLHPRPDSRVTPNSFAEATSVS